MQILNNIYLQLLLLHIYLILFQLIKNAFALEFIYNNLVLTQIETKLQKILVKLLSTVNYK